MWMCQVERERKRMKKQKRTWENDNKALKWLAVGVWALGFAGI